MRTVWARKGALRSSRFALAAGEPCRCNAASVRARVNLPSLTFALERLPITNITPSRPKITDKVEHDKQHHGRAVGSEERDVGDLGEAQNLNEADSTNDSADRERPFLLLLCDATSGRRTPMWCRGNESRSQDERQHCQRSFDKNVWLVEARLNGNEKCSVLAAASRAMRSGK